MKAADDILVATTNAAGSIVLGQATLTGAGSDQAPAGRTLLLSARGANADITYGSTTGSPLTGATNVVLTAGRDVTANVTGLLSLKTGTAGRNFIIRAGDLNVTGQLTAQTLRIESLTGPLTLGGASSAAPAAAGVARAPAPGMTISGAEFAKIKVSDQASFYAGSTATGAGSGDLVILDISVDPALTPHLLLAAGSSNDVMVSGVIAPLANGGTLKIGDTGAFAPSRILISGSVGSSSGSADTGYSGIRAFDSVGLVATNDILMGSARFLALISGLSPDQISISQNRPAGVAAAADELNHVFITAGVASLAAPNRLVQENTGTSTTANGLFLNNITPPVDTLLTVAPSRSFDLFGAFRDKSGVIRSGTSIGAGAILVTSPAGGSSGGSGGGGTVHLNGVGVVNGVSLAAGETMLKSAVAQLTLSSGSADSTSSASAGPSAENPSKSETVATKVATPPPPLIVVEQPDLQTITLDAVALGSGSDEIWRKHRK
jgi:hypothetical protein